MSTRGFVMAVVAGLALALAPVGMPAPATQPVRAQAGPVVISTPAIDKAEPLADEQAVPLKTDHSGRTDPPLSPPSSTNSSIRNGDFENGPDGSCYEYSYQGWEIILHKAYFPGPVAPHGGNWAAWLGGDHHEISYIRQTVTIPTSASTLRFWHWMASDDLCGYDLGWVMFDQTNLLTLDLCQPNNTGGWVERTVDISAYAGRTVSLQFRVETDGSLASNYFVDDVTLQGQAPAGYAVYLPLVLRDYWPGFFDDFSNPDSGWGSGEYPSVIYRYLNGEYQLYIKTTDSPFGITPDLVLPSDYRIEVDARKVSAGVCSYGLIFGCRFTEDSWETYQVIVWPTDREFLVNKRTLDGTWTTLQDWTYSPAINGGLETNRIRVERVGTEMRIYINGTEVSTINDGTFTGPGRDAGIRAYSYGDAPMDIRFDNFRASQP